MYFSFSRVCRRSKGGVTKQYTWYIVRGMHLCLASSRRRQYVLLFVFSSGVFAPLRDFCVLFAIRDAGVCDVFFVCRGRQSTRRPHADTLNWRTQHTPY